jgi:hypothetical protein
MKVLDAEGNVALVDRDTGKDHVCVLNIAMEILRVATPGLDGAPRYVDKDEWDGEVAVAPEVEGGAGGKVAPPRADQAKRDEDIEIAVAALDEHDFVKTGERAGRPKCSAVENIVGYPVFTDEVDAAWAKRPAA